VTPPRFSRIGAAIATLLLASACTGEPADTAFEPTPAIRVADAALLPATVDELPDMEVAGFDELRSQLVGTPLVVNFWATWCDPCRREMPMLAEAATRYDDRVQFLGVDILDNRDGARRFLADLAIPYPNVFDAQGLIRTSVGSIGQPVTVFYAADGTRLAKVDGELSPSDLQANLDALTG
jgi:cytochrome c biogenesis protein CcmG, thiol:disulfide interchange protein DsbE